MLGIFSDFAVNAKDIADKIGEKAVDTYDLTKLKAQQYRIEKQLSESFELLGEKLYKAQKSSDSDIDFKADIELIDELYAQISCIQKLVNDKKGEKVCPVCHAVMPKDETCCPQCKEKFNNSTDFGDNYAE